MIHWTLDKKHIYAYYVAMRRKPGTLLPLELSILDVGVDLLARGISEFHGFFIASEIREKEGARLLIAHGTLYRALHRMEKAGLVVSHSEDPDLADKEGRPRRRLYKVTVAGQKAMSDAQLKLADPKLKPKFGRALS